ncbi:hypothetical protein [Aureibaculum luteum]|uniref:hypothetical protein n=1 Tax=Aureibaculum luteum TaxID=1548456 RepID=UPI0013007345|nr:hypothetical protein [Aureibaculum luteum]
MIHIQTLVTKRIIIFVLILSSMSCSNGKEQNSLFKDTYMEILTGSIVDFRYMKPPTFEESQKGIKIQFPIKRPDTLSPLKLYVQKDHINIDFSEFENRLPEDFKFNSDSMSEIVDYLPYDVNTYSNKEYELISFKDLDKTFEKQKNQFDSGGILQFSKVLFNREKNKAILFFRDTRNELNSTESLILFKKINGKWVIFKSIGISLS